VKALLAWVLAVVLAAVAHAGEAVPVAADPALEARVERLAVLLRCLVCQNQSLADSNAPLALDLKNQVREQLRAGASETQVIDFMTARYGDFVLYKPPVKGTTALLWAGPALMFAAGVGVLVIVLRRRQRLADDAFEPETEQTDESTEAADAAKPDAR